MTRDMQYGHVRVVRGVHWVKSGNAGKDSTLVSLTVYSGNAASALYSGLSPVFRL